ncbi:MAG: 5-oxoprolinase [Acidiferrobacteraceae bacterium]|nr:5-oxoprolinase [Acidiferrobacteraceae bacterium]MDP7517523.1 hydantoinase B/oxoprolinase family protein [Arenicellales bacterium]
MNSVTEMSSIRMQIMWNRLISVVEEQAQTLIRTAFSTSVREAGDLAAAVFDNQGRMLAQAVTGTPGHINAMAEAIPHFIDRYAIATMAPGDVYITNDPWKTSGHLHDVTVVTPTFHDGNVVGLFANTCHVVDIGGRGFGPDANQVFEEGVNIPIMHLFRKGEVNTVLMDILRTNVREPRQVIGDIYAFAGANDIGCERLVRMLDEFDEDNLEALGEFIIENSRLATIERISKLKKGRYSNSVTMDGYDLPVTLVAELTIGDEFINVDYNGTSPASKYGINVVLNYTKAYTCFGVKCAVAPDIPNNYGSLLPITFSAPEGCILNVQRPFAVSARHIIGHLLPDTVLGCLHQVLESGCQSEGSASLWNVQLRGGPAVGGAADFDSEIPAFDLLHFNAGGMGARPTKDGLSATAFPSGIRGIPVEATEAISPVVFWRKEFREGSGGPGTYRGGCGQVIEIGGIDGIPFDVLAMFERVDNAPRGRNGGHEGLPGKVYLGSGSALRPKGQQHVPANDSLVLELAGGGGFGDPATRDPNQVARDVRNGLVSTESGENDYRVKLFPDGSVDLTSTTTLRVGYKK